MSTSPDTSTGNAYLRKNPQPGSGRDGPGKVLLKGLLWLALIVGVIVTLAFYYDIVWDVLINSIIPILGTFFEFLEDMLDGFFALVGLGSFAPMATIYTALVVALALLYFASRKGIKVYQRMQAKKQDIGQTYASAWEEWYGGVRTKATQKWGEWWNSLDIYNKAFAVIMIVLIGIPLLLLLSLLLGNLVASIL